MKSYWCYEWLILTAILTALSGLCRALPKEIYSTDVIPTNLTIPTIDDARPAYPCLGAMQIDVSDPNKLLISMCSHFSLGLSSAIGTLSLDNLKGPAQVLCGNITKPCRDRNVPDCYIDGVGTDASIITAEYLIQRSSDIVYFVDGQSCIRELDRSTSMVTTIIGIGSCGNGTLDMLTSEHDFASGLIRGFEYYEEKDLFFMAIINHGLWMYYKSENSWMRKILIDRDSISSTVSDLVRQIVIQDDTLWQRVWKGVNKYDLKNLSSDGEGQLHHSGTPYDYRFLSSPGGGTFDPTAKYNNIDPNLALGESDSQLSFPPNEETLMIVDLSQDRIFFMDPRTGNLSVMCTKERADERQFQSGNATSCKFKTLSGAVWLDNYKISIFDTNRDVHHPVFVTIDTEEPPPPTTTMVPTTTNELTTNKLTTNKLATKKLIANVFTTHEIPTPAKSVGVKPSKATGLLLFGALVLMLMV